MACPNMSLEVIVPLDGWSLWEFPWLTNLGGMPMVGPYDIVIIATSLMSGVDFLIKIVYSKMVILMRHSRKF